MNTINSSYLLFASVLSGFLGAVFSFFAFWTLNKITTDYQKVFKELEIFNILYHDIGQIRINLETLNNLNPADPLATIFLKPTSIWDQHRHLISVKNEDFLTITMVYARIQKSNEFGKVLQYNDNKLSRIQIITKQKSYLCIPEMDGKIEESLSLLNKKTAELQNKLKLPKWITFINKIIN